MGSESALGTRMGPGEPCGIGSLAMQTRRSSSPLTKTRAVIRLETRKGSMILTDHTSLPHTLALAEGAVT